MKLIDFSAFCFSTQTIHLRDAWLCITRLDYKYALLHDLDGFYVSTVITCGNNIMCFLFWYEFSILLALATYAQIDWCLPFQAISHAREAIRSANRTCDALEDPIKRVEPAHVKFVWPTFTKGGLKYLMNCFVLFFFFFFRQEIRLGAPPNDIRAPTMKLWHFYCSTNHVQVLSRSTRTSLDKASQFSKQFFFHLRKWNNKFNFTSSTTSGSH